MGTDVHKDEEKEIAFMWEWKPFFNHKGVSEIWEVLMKNRFMA